jgi:hypothetical protein
MNKGVRSHQEVINKVAKMEIQVNTAQAAMS